MQRKLIRKFQLRVTLALVACLLVAGGLSNYLIYRFTLERQFDDLRSKLMVIAQTATLLIDPGTLSAVPLTREGVNTEQYAAIVKQLNRIKSANPPIKYIYTMAPTGEEGVWQFIVDPDLGFSKGLLKALSSFPGDRYVASRFSEMLNGYKAPSADKKLEVDEWGVTLSGYAPILDSDGRPIAVLGIDIAAEDVYKLQEQVHRRAFVVLLMGIVISLILGTLLSATLTGRIEHLVDCTKKIANGELACRADTRGNDEIAELARSLNLMAVSLFDSRQKMQDYFYRALQALIRILEAKDSYTRGHSDRVAEYATVLGREMGLDSARLSLLKHAAQLHDIGKLGIQKTILNKTEKLTEEEWDTIRGHPIIGEDILKPVAFDEEMLTIVRSHHERYDGTGYPDGRKSSDIDVCAQIVSVVDAYDAMRSSRAYRPALSRQAAIDELKANRGTQLNPSIVDLFVTVIERDNLE